MRSTSRLAPPVDSTRSWPMERIGSPSGPARPRIISTSKVRWLMPQRSSRALPSRYSSRLAAPCRCPKASTSLSLAASRAVVISDSAFLCRLMAPLLPRGIFASGTDDPPVSSIYLT